MYKDLIGMELSQAIDYLKQNGIKYEIVSNDVEKEFPYDKTLVVKVILEGDILKIYTNRFLFKVK